MPSQPMQRLWRHGTKGYGVDGARTTPVRPPTPPVIQAKRISCTIWSTAKIASNVAIGEEHRESTRKHGQGEQEQKVGDEHAPHKQGNSLHRQCRPAHEKDGGENVDRAGKAAEPRQMEAHDGDVHADSDATAVRRVDGPPNTSADLHVDTTQEKQERRRQQHEADRVQPGQGHLRRPDLDGHQQIREATQERKWSGNGYR